MLSPGGSKHSTELTFGCARRELADDRALYDNSQCALTFARKLAGLP